MRNSFLKKGGHLNESGIWNLIFGISLGIGNWVLEILRRIIVFLIISYQRTFSPDHGVLGVLFPFGVCRYTPTCSDYAKESITRYGPIRGSIMGIKRIVRCNPFVPGGYDPVPDFTNNNSK